MNPSSRLLIPVIIAASSVAASAAVTTTQTYYIPNDGINNILNIATTASTPFNKFNASTGRTLTEVVITYSLNILSGDVIADNDGVLGFNATITGSLAGTLSKGTGLSALPDNLLLANQSGTTVFLGPENGDGAGVVDSTGPDGTIFSIAGLTDTKSLTINSGIEDGDFYLSKFIGTSTFVLNYTASRAINITGGAAEGGYTTSAVGGYITVSYTSIPEVFSSVATASVLLLGFVGYRPRRDAQAT
jgi:hypothetical protein